LPGEFIETTMSHDFPHKDLTITLILNHVIQEIYLNLFMASPIRDLRRIQ